MINEALLLNIHQTWDTRGNLIGQRKDGGLYYLFDGLGSVVAITDGSGNVRNRYAYDPYGTPLASGTSEEVGNPWGFAGGYRDTTGLIKFGARYYDPSLGRWTQRDPVPSELPYAYAGDNPVNFVDPSGNNAVSDFFTKKKLTAAQKRCLKTVAAQAVAAGVTAGVVGSTAVTPIGGSGIGLLTGSSAYAAGAFSCLAF